MSLADLLAKLDSVSLVEENSSEQAQAAAASESCPLAHLPYDIVTHHLLPQLTTPTITLANHPVPQPLPSATPLHSLAATNKHFHSLVSAQYKTYLQAQYPAVYASLTSRAARSGIQEPDWHLAVKSAEQLATRWSHRQFYISFIDVVYKPGTLFGSGEGPGVPKTKRNGYSPETLRPRVKAFSPCLDAYEDYNGRETLVIGQGPEIAVRFGEEGGWRTVRRDGVVSGRDDVLGVHMFDGGRHAIASRGGGVEVIAVGETEADELKTAQVVEVEGGKVVGSDGLTSSCLDNDDGQMRKLAVTTSYRDNEHKVLLFSVDKEHDGESVTVSTSPTAFAAVPSKPWRSTFLSPNTLLVGHRTGISSYSVTPTGLLPTHLPQPTKDYSHDLGVHALTRLQAPFSPSLFASGWSDGITRLFDLRVPHSPASGTNAYVATYLNTITSSPTPIYSLLHTSPLSNNLLAGPSQLHALEIHDLRYSSSLTPDIQSYAANLLPSTISKHALNGTSPLSIRPVVSTSSICFLGGMMLKNKYTNKPEPVDVHTGTYTTRNNYTRPTSSAIYSLVGSPGSGRVYIGIENKVLEMDFRPVSQALDENGRERGVKRVMGMELGRRKETEKGVPAAEWKAGLGVPMWWLDPSMDLEGGENGETASGWGGSREMWVGKPLWGGLGKRPAEEED